MALQNEFIRLTFCQLPEKEIFFFLKHIVKEENLNITTEQLKSILYMFKSDMRSMINYIQSNQYINLKKNRIMTKKFWVKFISLLKENRSNKQLIKFIEEKCIDFNMDKPNFIKNFINYLLENTEYACTEDWFLFFGRCIHSNCNIIYKLNYFLLRLKTLYKSL